MSRTFRRMGIKHIPCQQLVLRRFHEPRRKLFFFHDLALDLRWVFFGPNFTAPAHGKKFPNSVSGGPAPDIPSGSAPEMSTCRGGKTVSTMERNSSGYLHRRKTASP